MDSLEDHPLYPENGDRIEWEAPILDLDKMSEEDREKYEKALEGMFDYMRVHMEIASKYSEQEEEEEEQ